MRRLSTWTPLSLLVLSLSIVACSGSSPDDPASLITRFLEEKEFNGAVLVAKDGEILLSRGFDLANRDTNLPNSAETRFRIGSITKQFTAMAIMILQSESRIDVQQPICPYIADCPVAWENITIHHLLTHTSGIPNFVRFADYVRTWSEPSSPAQTIARFKDKSLEFQPGEDWRYSDSGYILLGYIIEQVSGETYETFLRTNIFTPLQMSNTGYDHDDGSLAKGYRYRGFSSYNSEYIHMSIPFAAGALYSTVEDLYRWDRALYTDQLIPYGLLELMFTPHVTLPLPDPKPKFATNVNYGYGWIVGTSDERPGPKSYNTHDGSINGFSSSIFRYPDDNITIIILGNHQLVRVGYYAGEDISDILFRE